MQEKAFGDCSKAGLSTVDEPGGRELRQCICGGPVFALQSRATRRMNIQRCGRSEGRELQLIV